MRCSPHADVGHCHSFITLLDLLRLVDVDIFEFWDLVDTVREHNDIEVGEPNESV